MAPACYLARAASSGRPRCQGSATRVTQPGQRYQGYAAGAALLGLRSRGGATETARLGLRSRYGAPSTLGGSIEQLTELSNS